MISTAGPAFVIALIVFAILGISGNVPLPPITLRWNRRRSINSSA
jgi:hypothetical protein